MKIGLSYDLKPESQNGSGDSEDTYEEYDPPSTIDALASNIRGLGHQVEYLGGGPSFLDKVRRAPVDFVFNIAEGRGTYRSREAQVPSILELLGIPYSGSDPLTLALCLDKPLAKRIAFSAGVDTAPYQVVNCIDDLSRLRDGALKFPVVVKPAFEGSSKGIRLTSLVHQWSDLHQPVSTVLANYHQPVIVEEFIAGKEVTVGVVGNDHPNFLGIMEIGPKMDGGSNFMYTLEVKRAWESLVTYRCPPDLPDVCIEAIEKAALTLFKAFQCRDVARFDFRVDKSNRPIFLEANPLPGLSPVNSDLPLMAQLSGWSYSDLIEAILNSALKRHGLATPLHAHRSRI